MPIKSFGSGILHRPQIDPLTCFFVEGRGGPLRDLRKKKNTEYKEGIGLALCRLPIVEVDRVDGSCKDYYHIILLYCALLISMDVNSSYLAVANKGKD